MHDARIDRIAFGVLFPGVLHLMFALAPSSMLRAIADEQLTTNLMFAIWELLVKHFRPMHILSITIDLAWKNKYYIDEWQLLNLRHIHDKNRHCLAARRTFDGCFPMNRSRCELDRKFCVKVNL